MRYAAAAMVNPTAFIVADEAIKLLF